VGLLLGGAGTFAFWNSSIAVDAQAITTGTLAVSDPSPGDGVWTVQKNGTGTASTVASIATFRASPGDRLTYSKTVKITASGDNLTATLSLGAGSIAANSSSVAADAALAGYLTRSATISASGTGVTTTGGTITVAPGSAGIVGQNVLVAVDVVFPKSTVAGAENATKTGAVKLSGLTVDLTQT
jgi:alternate signal-mediated exported protein